MATSLLVRHGAMRFLGTFDPGEGKTYKRGERVVIRTDRGVEVGDVLGEAVPQAVKQLSDPTSGQIIRSLSGDDNAVLARVKETERRELETCQQFVTERRLQMELVDAEHLFGGERVVFYFLA